MTEFAGDVRADIAAVEIEDAATMAAETPHAFLRRVSRPWHDGVEAAFERFDLQSIGGLAAFLLRQAMAVLPLEAALDAAGVEALFADWPARRRGALLTADLDRLGLRCPKLNAIPHLPDRRRMLGALYVLEGSKLGGRVLHRWVSASPDPRVRSADAFLGHRQDRGWSGFLAVLDALPPDPGTRRALRDGARDAFALFHAAAESQDETRFTDAPTCFGLYHPADA